MSSQNPIALPFPEGPDLNRFLNLTKPANLEELLQKTLTNPLVDFLSRPRKNFRDQIVQLGFSLVSKNSQHSESEIEAISKACCAILEIFHAGSLIVDDIEDESQFRRGARTLHQIYGIPLALNAGNWLYFLPFKLIEEMPLPSENRAALIRHCNETLLRAHYGQALDLGVPVDSLEQKQVPATTLAAMELKSGVLTGLALKIGAVALGADADSIRDLDTCGRKLGIALQMLDDIGSLTSTKNPEKRCEDLKLRRLGFVFSQAAESLSSENYHHFMSLLDDCQKNLDEILSLLQQFEIPQKAKQQAENYLSDVVQVLHSQFQFSEQDSKMIHSLQTSLVTSYA